MTSRPFASVLVLVLLGVPAAASAQRRSWPAPSHGFRIEDGVVATALGVASTVLVAPVDSRLRTWAVGGPDRKIPIVRHIDAIFKPMGERLPIGLAGAAWLIGAATGQEELADAGVITVEAIGATMVVKGVTQRLTGRRRPGEEPHDPADWGFARGFGDRALRSFPSGHAANAFALAAVVSEELHHTHSRSYRVAMPTLYLAASITSLSRVLDDEHWLSDVVAGAVLGGVLGETVADLNGR